MLQDKLYLWRDITRATIAEMFGDFYIAARRLKDINRTEFYYHDTNKILFATIECEYGLYVSPHYQLKYIEWLYYLALYAQTDDIRYKDRAWIEKP